MLMHYTVSSISVEPQYAWFPCFFDIVPPLLISPSVTSLRVKTKTRRTKNIVKCSSVNYDGNELNLIPVHTVTVMQKDKEDPNPGEEVTEDEDSDLDEEEDDHPDVSDEDCEEEESEDDDPGPSSSSGRRSNPLFSGSKAPKRSATSSFDEVDSSDSSSFDEDEDDSDEEDLDSDEGDGEEEEGGEKKVGMNGLSMLEHSF